MKELVYMNLYDTLDLINAIENERVNGDPDVMYDLLVKYYLDTQNHMKKTIETGIGETEYYKNKATK